MLVYLVQELILIMTKDYKKKYVQQKVEQKKKSSKTLYKYIPVHGYREFDNKFHKYDEEGNLIYLGDYKLVNTLEELEEFVELCKDKIIGFDTETTGLNSSPREEGGDYIVGFSLSLDDNSGIYCPLRHMRKKEVGSEKVPKLDEEGNVVYTKTGRVSQTTVKTYEYSLHNGNICSKEVREQLELQRQREETQKLIDGLKQDKENFLENSKDLEKEVVEAKLGSIDCMIGDFEKHLSEMEVSSYVLTEEENERSAKKSLDILYKALTSAKLVVIHNAEFDLNMYKKEGYSIEKVNFFDSMILPYLFDAESKMAGLKLSAKLYLGRTMLEFPGEFKYVCPYDRSTVIYACHDDQTEVLTENGWVMWKDYNGEDLLATVNVEKDELEYQRPLRLYAYEYKGEMISYKSKHLDFCVTPNHNMLVKRAQHKEWVFKQAKDLLVEESGYKAPTEKKGSGKDSFHFSKNVNLTPVQLARLTGALLADGWIVQRGDKQVCYHIGLAVCSDKFKKELENMLMETNMGFRPNKREKGNSWVCYNKKFYNWIKPYMEGKAQKKYIPPEIFKMDSYCINEFLKYFNYCDGSRKTDSAWVFYTTSIKMANQLQELLMLGGRTSILTLKAPPKKDCVIRGRVIKRENVHQIYSVYTQRQKSVRYKKYQREIVPYSGVVYCAEVPNHTLITRRNGKVLVSGNCADSCCCLALFYYLYPKVKKLISTYPNIVEFNGKKFDVIKSDNTLIRYWIDYYGHTKLYIDKEEAKKYKEKAIEVITQLKEEIYNYFDIGIFNLSTSSKEFKNAMASKNIDTGARTDTDQISFGKKDGTRIFSKNLTDLRGIIEKLEKNEEGYFTKGFCASELHIREHVDMFYLYKILEAHGSDYFQVMQLNNNTIRVLSRAKRKNKNKKLVPLKKGSRILNRKYFLKILKIMLKKENEKLSILKKIQKYSTMNKAINSYIDKLTKVDECRMRYKLFGTASGRFASGNGSKSDKKTKNPYYIDLNAQNLSKPSGAIYKAYKSEKEGNILGWCFDLMSDEDIKNHTDSEDCYLVEGFSPNFNIRNCVVVPSFKKVNSKKKIILSVDYSSQEDVLLTNYSKDSVKLSNFREGIDPHTATAYAIWGRENYNKGLRKIAKAVNFAINYSGNSHTISKNAGIPLEQAKALYDAYCEAFFGAMQWRQNEINKMWNNAGTTFTFCGRPRRFGSYVNMAERIEREAEDPRKGERESNNMISAAERRVSSHIIQGSAGDIMRIVLKKMYQKIFSISEKEKECAFLSTIHDEVNLYVDLDKIVEYTRLIEDIMYFSLPDWPLPIKATIGLGYRFGQIFDFKWVDDESRTTLIPKPL